MSVAAAAKPPPQPLPLFQDAAVIPTAGRNLEELAEGNLLIMYVLWGFCQTKGLKRFTFGEGAAVLIALRCVSHDVTKGWKRFLTALRYVRNDLVINMGGWVAAAASPPPQRSSIIDYEVIPNAAKRREEPFRH